MYVLLIIAIYSDSCVEKTLIYYPHITKKCDICDMIQIETIFDILVKGFIIGVVVSAPLGPVGVLCIQRTLNKGRWYGFVTGLGASLSDIAYALLTGYGMSFVFDYINKNIFYLQLLGSVMLLLFGIYTFRSNPVQSIRPASSSKGSYFHNFITAFFVTLSNPLIIFLFIGLFARFAFVQPGVLVFEEITGYLAIAIGALTWWLGITYFVNKVRTKFNSGICCRIDLYFVGRVTLLRDNIMNQIAQQLKEKNIAEYLIYMWQEEDLIRANHCEPEEMEANVIARYPEEQRPAMREWYTNLITMMGEEGVREKGHLQINKNVIINLTELHNALSSSPKFPFYSAAYFKALPFIVELRNKNGKKDEPELETCFEALYGVLLLRLQKKSISEGTAKAVEAITSFLSMLANYYDKDRKGELKLDE